VEGLPQLVRELMTVGVLTCTPDTPIVDIAALFLDRNLEEIVVMEEGNAIGVIGQDELVSVIENSEWQSLTAGEIMREDILQLPPNIPLVPAVQLMKDHKVRAIFLMHHSGGIVYPAGVLTYRHILRLIAAKNSEELADLGISASRQLPVDAFRKRRDETRNKLLST